MNAIQRFFIRAEHWQVFVIVVGSMCVTQIVVIATYPKGDTFKIPIGALIAAELWYSGFVAWFWSLGSLLNSSVKTDLRLNIRFFRFALIYPLIYMAAFQVMFAKPPTAYAILILPFHLLATYCVFFNLNFVSKSLVLAEAGRAVSFNDYAGPFFLLWFFPLGIWFIQSRINRLYAATTKTATA